jgi:hypothetical protein
MFQAAQADPARPALAEAYRKSGAPSALLRPDPRA